MEDPSWAAWAVPSPVCTAGTGGFTKVKKEVPAKTHQRVRERLPRLPELVGTTEAHHGTQKMLLAASQATAVGEAFDYERRRYRRISRREDRTETRFQYRSEMVLIEDMAAAEQFDVVRDEDEAFRAWAVIEMLRHTGVRLEEPFHAPRAGVLSAPRHR
ncbi:hypothetical protein OG426_53465 [Streptomyces canus]|uniref:hypothetical protein n=1 Tax=Streptomyces canus TaxID=58343 RepID=UPI00225732CD|nr:hypothetical protein [Streptomyces canus]MCX4853928.1 hypothetical protein [Streptomyces canus]WSW40610.1 hypothetical protein OG426_53465 [Streptomyces canus]